MLKKRCFKRKNKQERNYQDLPEKRSHACLNSRCSVSIVEVKKQSNTKRTRI